METSAVNGTVSGAHVKWSVVLNKSGTTAGSVHVGTTVVDVIARCSIGGKCVGCLGAEHDRARSCVA